MEGKGESWGGWAFPLLAMCMLIARIGVATAQSDETVDALNARVEELYTAGRYGEAVSIAQRAVELAERRFGPDHPHVAQSLEKVATLYYKQGRHAEAEPLYRRALLVAEKALGASHLDVGTLLNNLAVLLHTQGRYDDAEPLFKRALSVRETALGPDHRHVGTTLNNLAVLYAVGGRYAEAEAAYRRSLAIREKASGPEDPSVGESLNNLAMLFESQGRYDDAEPLLLRSLAIRQKAMGPIEPGMRLGPASHDLAVTFNNLAGLYHTQGRYTEAKQAFTVIASLLETILGPSHPDVATALNNIAEVLRAQGRHSDAEPVFRRALSIWEATLGPAHPLVGVALDNLGLVHQAQRSYAEAERSYERSLGIREKAYGSDHPELAQSLNNLAVLAFIRRDWMRAADYWRRSTSLIVRRGQRGAFGATPGRASGEVERSSHQFRSLAKAIYRLPLGHPSKDSVRVREGFLAAQWAIASKAAQALTQMAARGARGDPMLAVVVRERQDLIAEWHRRDAARTAAVAQPPDKRDFTAETTNVERLAAIDARIADIDRRLEIQFPDYASLASPAPLSIEEVQAYLREDEALALFLDTPELEPASEETFIWIVTKTAARWARSDLGSMGLAREVTALRCGLDAAAWDGPGAERCAKTLDIAPGKLPDSSGPLPFDHTRAHRLYMGLFGDVQDLIRGKHLLIVPSGPLTQLPFQVLVTEGVKPSGLDSVPLPSIREDTAQQEAGGRASGLNGLTSNHRTVAWLARAHAVTILPAVTSLKALRRVGGPSTAPRPMIGFGNPLLDGPDPRYDGLASLARTKQRCPEMRAQWATVPAVRRAGAAGLDTRGGLADLAQIRMQVPLPETADELCAVAHDMKAHAQDIRLGAQATEREVKRLSASGELARYRLVHFATHGALAGELDGKRDPGLILTPPGTASEEDDGYLSASEIAGLKLDADWVVLSACNTAAGAARSAEALSGLARAFIYAQARALLVSHWAVDSDATVKLVTAAAREMARDAKVGRAEAVRRAMLTLIDKGAREEAHPSYWAPFVVVGEGASSR
jgi:tetratricopeptide (TPR) repeat protein